MKRTEILEAIVKKLEDIISNLRLQHLFPEPTTFEAEGKYMALLLKKDTLDKELSDLKQQLSQLNSPINHPDFFDSKKDYCAKCAAKMKALNETKYICMNPECDNYLKTE